MFQVAAVRTTLAPDVQAFDDFMAEAADVGESVAAAASPSAFVQTSPAAPARSSEKGENAIKIKLRHEFTSKGHEAIAR